MSVNVPVLSVSVRLLDDPGLCSLLSPVRGAGGVESFEGMTVIVRLVVNYCIIH